MIRRIKRKLLIRDICGTLTYSNLEWFCLCDAHVEWRGNWWMALPKYTSHDWLFDVCRHTECSRPTIFISCTKFFVHVLLLVHFCQFNALHRRTFCAHCDIIILLKVYSPCNTHTWSLILPKIREARRTISTAGCLSRRCQFRLSPTARCFNQMRRPTFSESLVARRISTAIPAGFYNSLIRANFHVHEGDLWLGVQVGQSQLFASVRVCLLVQQPIRGSVRRRSVRVLLLRIGLLQRSANQRPVEREVCRSGCSSSQPNRDNVFVACGFGICRCDDSSQSVWTWMMTTRAGLFIVGHSISERVTKRRVNDFQSGGTESTVLERSPKCEKHLEDNNSGSDGFGDSCSVMRL